MKAFCCEEEVCDEDGPAFPRRSESQKRALNNVGAPRSLTKTGRTPSGHTEHCEGGKGGKGKKNGYMTTSRKVKESRASGMSDERGRT